MTTTTEENPFQKVDPTPWLNASARGSAAAVAPAASMLERCAKAVWGTYSRISEDPDVEDDDTGRRGPKELGVTDQNKDTAEAIRGLGGIPPAPGSAHQYVENDTSAYRRKLVWITDQYGERRQVRRVMRPVWAAAMKALRDGEITALMVPNLDRLARDERDFFDAVEAVEDFGRIVVSATQSDIDLTTESGIMMGGMMVKFANKSSRDTSRRVARAALRDAETGKAVGGIRPFGFSKDKVTHDETEAALIREAAADIVNGVSLRTVARRWNDAGIVTSTGGPWHPNTVRQILKGPRVAGWRVHQGRVHMDKNGNPVRGEWNPILDQDTWERVLAVFSAPDRLGKRTRPGHRKYLLTGLVRCGKCGQLMYGNGFARHPVEHEARFSYACTNKAGIIDPHAVTVSGNRLDAYVEKLVLLRLTGEQYEVKAPAFDGDARLAAVKAKIGELMAAFDADEVPGSIVFPRVKQLTRERDELAAAREAFIVQTTGPSLSGITPKKWNGWGLEDKQPRLAQMLDAVYIRPTTSRGPKLDLSRVVPVWKGDDTPDDIG